MFLCHSETSSLSHVHANKNMVVKKILGVMTKILHQSGIWCVLPNRFDFCFYIDSCVTLHFSVSEKRALLKNKYTLKVTNSMPLRLRMVNFSIVGQFNGKMQDLSIVTSCSVKNKTWIFILEIVSVLVFQHMDFIPIRILNDWKRCNCHDWCILSGVLI